MANFRIIKAVQLYFQMMKTEYFINNYETELLFFL